MAITSAGDGHRRMMVPEARPSMFYASLRRWQRSRGISPRIEDDEDGPTRLEIYGGAM